MEGERKRTHVAVQSAVLANTLDGFWTFSAEQNLWKDTTPTFGRDGLTVIWDLHVE